MMDLSTVDPEFDEIMRDYDDNDDDDDEEEVDEDLGGDADEE
jgi:hypothetical protein